MRSACSAMEMPRQIAGVATIKFVDCKRRLVESNTMMVNSEQIYTDSSGEVITDHF